MNEENIDRLRVLLENVKVRLERDGEGYGSDLIESALRGSANELESFLTSNELWGGSGSVADQAGMGPWPRDDRRRRIEAALVELGEEQVRVGLLNQRTEMWIDAFKQWKRQGL